MVKKFRICYLVFLLIVSAVIEAVVRTLIDTNPKFAFINGCKEQTYGSLDKARMSWEVKIQQNFC